MRQHLSHCPVALMTEKTATQVANVVLGAAAVGALYVIARTPRLRRFAIGLAVSALTGAVPAWLTRELQQAWTESAERGPHQRAAI